MSTTEDFKLLLGAEIRPESVKKELDKIPESARTIELKVKGDNTYLKHTNTEGNKTITTMDKINTKSGEVTRTFARIKESASGMNKELKESSKNADVLGKSFADTFTKVAKFYVITKIIQTITEAMGEAVTAVKEFDSAMTDFKKVSDLSGDSLDAYADKLGKLGESVYRSKTEMLGAATVFKQGGFTDDESANLARTASLFQNISDAEISSADSASVIISQLKAFDMKVTDSEKVIDSINEVDELAFPFGNNWVIKDNYIGQTLGIEETEQRRFDKIKIKVDNFKEKCYNILLRNWRIIIT